MNSTLVKDFMDKTYPTLSPDSDVYNAIDLMLDKGCTSVVVVNENNKIVGILSEKDCQKLLFKSKYHELPGGKVEDYMTKDVVTVTASTDIFQAAKMFMDHSFRRLVVADEDNTALGQITRRDLLRVIKALKKEKGEKKIAPIL
jgi:predicted transcriptional regulator